MPKFDFKRRRRGNEPQSLGLVVGLRALTPTQNGGVDELAVWEQAYRRKGRPAVVFEEDEDNVPSS
ncbi:hypothetical protein SAMN05444171_4062 [Bradyrhizobium lablabi]|uniref:Uncharacterized protein n=2 Tax=Bradyrhizobium TaxID=374 RepID=A0ABY0PK19_9BRAD|nr:hypothetical protein SAMN05444163_3107 [Bradyrhizobium ottawaense]SED42122.1 hypothetical protein SAMN05444171_4062 [Bradyrhizobium lablabi]